MKRLCFALLLSCCWFSDLRAQSWLWARESYSANMTEGWGVSSDPAGNAAITGGYYYSTDFGSFTLNSVGQKDIYVAKYDPSGNVLWARSEGGASSEYGTCVAEDAFGNTYVAGMFGSSSITFGTTTLTSNNLFGNANLFLLKYDPAGTLLWARGASGNSINLPYDLKTDATGNVIMCGNYRNAPIGFGPVTLLNHGLDDYFVVKYDSNGNVLWAKGGGSTGNDDGLSLATDANGNIFLGGRFDSTVTFGTTTFTSIYGDGFVLKYNSTGAIQWARQIAGDGVEVVHDLAIDAAGNIFCCGQFASDTIIAGNFICNGTDQTFNMFVCKLSPAGNPLWLKAGSSQGQNMAYSAAVDASGHILIGGEMTSPLFTYDGTELVTCPTQNYIPMFLLQLDEAGSLVCSTTLASGGNIVDIAPDPFGNLYVCSDFFLSPNTMEVGGDVLNAGGLPSQTFLAKRGSMSGSIVTTPSSCLTPTGTATATITGNNPQQYSYNWMPSGGTGPAATGLSPGTYTFTVTDPEGCVSTQTVQVQPLSTPGLSVSSGVDIHPGDSTLLVAVSDGTITWSPAGELSCIACAETEASPLWSTDYCATATDTNGCTSTACVRVNVEDCIVYVPNAFSPNNDGQNDLLCVRGYCVDDIHFSVFDRWGTRVFESNDQEICWDGTYHGTALENAVFTYTLKATLKSGHTVVKSGNITLFR